MYVYEIGYHSCEDSSYGQWYHEKKYTKEELFDIVVEGLKVARDEWWEKNGERVAAEPPEERKWLEPRFSDLVSCNERFDQYLENVGFTKVKMEARISLFGWARAEVPGDWESYAGDPTGDAQIRLAKPK